MKEESLKILKKLVNHNYQAYIVGGFVRDTILGLDIYDVDICTDATPKEIKNIFSDAIISPFEYGSIRIKLNNIDFEITTFRKEIKYVNNRKPVEIKYVNNLVDDLLRRDFTINTLCMDKDGNIIDLLEAKSDLDQKIIRTVGKPAARIIEDSLRILRAIRFATVLNFNLDNSLKEAIVTSKELLLNLSFQRKKEELNRIFMSTNKKIGVNLIKELDLCNSLSITNIDKALLTDDLLGIWAMIDTKDCYSFTREEKSIISDIRSLMQEDLNDKMVLYKYGTYCLSIVCDLKKLDKVYYLRQYNNLIIKGRNEIDISVGDICNILNKKPDSFIRKILCDIEENIINEKISNIKNTIEKYVVEKYGDVYEK